mmetsp:Transcript_118182/g.314477  ORF Transcript_118182/g.314477 Transcript_118182/m.314477 type:complete len:310 (+) Transcript_118182:206-1135(+)
MGSFIHMPCHCVILVAAGRHAHPVDLLNQVAREDVELTRKELPLCANRSHVIVLAVLERGVLCLVHALVGAGATEGDQEAGVWAANPLVLANALHALAGQGHPVQQLVQERVGVHVLLAYVSGPREHVARGTKPKLGLAGVHVLGNVQRQHALLSPPLGRVVPRLVPVRAILADDEGHIDAAVRPGVRLPVADALLPQPSAPHDLAVQVVPPHREDAQDQLGAGVHGLREVLLEPVSRRPEGTEPVNGWCVAGPRLDHGQAWPYPDRVVLDEGPRGVVRCGTSAESHTQHAWKEHTARSKPCKLFRYPD